MLTFFSNTTDNNYFSYEITNHKNNKIREVNGRLLTDKKTPSAHGFGIANVKEIVDKYNGTMHIAYTDDTFTVTSYFIIHMYSSFNM